MCTTTSTKLFYSFTFFYFELSTFLHVLIFNFHLVHVYAHTTKSVLIFFMISKLLQAYTPDTYFLLYSIQGTHVCTSYNDVVEEVAALTALNPAPRAGLPLAPTRTSAMPVLRPIVDSRIILLVLGGLP